MVDIIAFARSYEGLKAREKQYLDDAIRQAKERAREDRIAVYRGLHQMIRVDGVRISEICRETGLSRTSIYRWLDEYDQVTGYVEELASGRLEWSDVKLMPTGEVSATDKNGDSWLLTEDAEAWNRTKNKTVDGFSNWPLGAKDAFDTATQA